jgi:hypothetical protein
VVKPRMGGTRLGCLMMLLAIGGLGYGVSVTGPALLHYYEFQDAMNTEARFAARNSDEVIVAHLRATADSLDLPDAARMVYVRRSDRSIEISASYVEPLVLPGIERSLALYPHAERAF